MSTTFDLTVCPTKTGNPLISEGYLCLELLLFSGLARQLRSSRGKVAVNFWKLEHPPGRLAVVDVHSGRERTYGELRADVERAAMEMRPEMPKRGKENL